VRVSEVHDPQQALADSSVEAATVTGSAVGELGHRTLFVRLEQASLSWWQPVCFEIRPALEIAAAAVDREQPCVTFTVRNNTDRPVMQQVTICGGLEEHAARLEIGPHATSAPLHAPRQDLVPGTNPLVLRADVREIITDSVVDWRASDSDLSQLCDCVDLSGLLNARVSEIFRHEYRSPRSPYCSLQMPLHGHGDWCYCGRTVPAIDDSALRAAAGESGRFVSPQGIPFATPGPGTTPNVMFTSQWDNFPAELVVPLTGRARHAWFLVAGSTHPMHSQLDNGELVITYEGGTASRLALRNPTTWWPIEADYDTVTDGFCIPGPHPPRIDLGSGRATVLDLPLDPERPLQSLTVRCVANEVVVGLMAVTLQRP